MLEIDQAKKTHEACGEWQAEGSPVWLESSVSVAGCLG